MKKGLKNFSMRLLNSSPKAECLCWVWSWFPACSFRRAKQFPWLGHLGHELHLGVGHADGEDAWQGAVANEDAPLLDACVDDRKKLHQVLGDVVLGRHRAVGLPLPLELAGHVVDEGVSSSFHELKQCSWTTRSGASFSFASSGLLKFISFFFNIFIKDNYASLAVLKKGKI